MEDLFLISSIILVNYFIFFEKIINVGTYPQMRREQTN